MCRGKAIYHEIRIRYGYLNIKLQRMFLYATKFENQTLKYSNFYWNEAGIHFCLHQVLILIKESCTMSKIAKKRQFGSSKLIAQGWKKY